MSTTYCIKCKSKTTDVTPQVHQLHTTRGIRYQRRSICHDCGGKKCQFVSAAHGQGLITDLIKAAAPGTADTIDKVQNTMSRIPLIGPLLGSVI